MRIGCWLLLPLLTLLAFSAGPAHGQEPAPLPPALRHKVESLLQASTVRGAAIVLVDASGPTHALWYGLADAAHAVPITPQTCMRAGSVSQTFTAMLAMRLADQGKLSLDDPLPADLQPATSANSAAACTGRVTVAQLLEHTAGVTGSPQAGCPGLHYNESDDGIALAATAVERAGGADFDTLMRREVFAPLSLTDAGFTTGAMPACLSRSYEADGRAFEQLTQLAQPPARAANALVVTPMDLARVVQMLLSYGDSPAGNVLEPCSIAHMAAGTTGLAGRHGAVAGAHGKGLTRFVAADRLMIGQAGHIDGFQTLFGFATETGSGMVIMLNTADQATMHRLREAVAAHLWRGVPAPPLPPLARPAEDIEGWYVRAGNDAAWNAPWSALWNVVRIEAEPSGLALRPLWPWGRTRHVLAATDTSFREEALPMASMAFVRDHDGRRWWIDRESHVEVDPLAVMATLASVASGLPAAAFVSGFVLAVGKPWSGRRAPGRLRHQTAQ